MVGNYVAALMDEIQGLDVHNAVKLYECLCTQDNFKVSKSDSDFKYIVLDEKTGGGESIKPSNILLDMKKLLVDSAEIGLTLSGILSTPYIIPLAALVIWNKIESNLKVELNEHHAFVIKKMWNHHKNLKIAEPELLEAISLEKNDLMLNSDEVKVAIDELNKIGCIELISSDPKTWKLVEEIRSR